MTSSTLTSPATTTMSAPVAGGFDALCSRRRRRPTSNVERQYLESAYSKNRRPDAASRVKISEHLGWTEKAVMVWFQNRRQKDKSGDSASTCSSSLPGSRLSSPSCTPAPASAPRRLTPVPTVSVSTGDKHANQAPSPKLPPTPTTPSFGTQPTAPCSPMTLPASHFPPTPAMSTPELTFDDSDLEGDFQHVAVPGAVVLTPLISPHPRPTPAAHEPTPLSISRPSSPLLLASSTPSIASAMPPVALAPLPPHLPSDQHQPILGCTRLPSVRTWLDRVVACTEAELNQCVPSNPASFRWVMDGMAYTGAGHPIPRPTTAGTRGPSFHWPSLPRLVPTRMPMHQEPPKTPTLPPLPPIVSPIASPLDALREVCAREHAVMASSRPHAARARAGAAPY